MNLVNELQSEIALAFFEGNMPSEKFESQEIVEMFNRIEVLFEVYSGDDDQCENFVITEVFDAPIVRIAH